MSTHPPSSAPDPGLNELQTQLQEGLRLHQTGRLIEAERLYRSVLQAAPHHLDGLQLLAILLAQRGAPSEAVPLFKRALEIAPQNPGLLGNAALAHIDLGDLDSALEHYDVLRNLRPEAPEVHFSWADCQLKRGDFDAAMKGFRLAWAKSDQFHQAQAALANVLRLTHQYADALESLNAAIRLAPHDVGYKINKALLLCDLKAWPEASEAIEAALELEQGMFEAWNVRGNIALHRGDPKEALLSFQQARALNSGDLEIHLNQGIALAALSRHEEALGAFQEVLSHSPDHSVALFHQVMSLESLGKLHGQGVIEALEPLLERDPVSLNALNAVGLRYRDLGRYKAALNAFDRILVLDANNAAAHANRGAVFNDQGRFEEARNAFEQALQINPELPEALINQIRSLVELQRYEEAISRADQAIAINPSKAEAHMSRGMALAKCQQPKDALAAFSEALRLNPLLLEAYINRADHLRLMGRLEDALGDARRALSIDPHSAAAFNSLGLTLQEQLDLKEAMAAFNQAIHHEPEFADAQFNKGLLNLLLGDLLLGGEGYEWRWRGPLKSVKRDFDRPLWLGDCSLEGKTILISSEQGLGDAIQTVRFLPLLADMAARVIVEYPAGLKGLFSTLKGSYEWIERGQLLPNFDLYCPLMSLPHAFKTLISSIPKEIPYLTVPEERLNYWSHRLGSKLRPRLGLVWKGNPQHSNNHNRSMPLEAALPLFSCGYDVHILQKDLTLEERDLLGEVTAPLTIHGDSLGDFSDTAALVHLMDVVVTVDTSVAHLSGALGRPVFVLLADFPDFRWFLQREDSPWYPSARLFRQPRRGDWGAVIEAVQHALTHRKR